MLGNQSLLGCLRLALLELLLLRGQLVKLGRPGFTQLVALLFEFQCIEWVAIKSGIPVNLVELLKLGVLDALAPCEMDLVLVLVVDGVLDVVGVLVGVLVGVSVGVLVAVSVGVYVGVTVGGTYRFTRVSIARVRLPAGS